MTNWQEVGARITRLRKEKGLSQSALAELVGLSTPGIVSLHETGKQRLSQETMEAYVAALQTNELYLRFGIASDARTENQISARARADALEDAERAIYNLRIHGEGGPRMHMVAETATEPYGATLPPEIESAAEHHDAAKRAAAEEAAGQAKGKAAPRRPPRKRSRGRLRRPPED